MATPKAPPRAAPPPMDAQALYRKHVAPLARSHVGVLIAGSNHLLSIVHEADLGPPIGHNAHESIFLLVKHMTMPSGLPVAIVLSRVDARNGDPEFVSRTCICVLVPRGSDVPFVHEEKREHTTLGTKWTHLLPIKLFSRPRAGEPGATRESHATFSDDGLEVVLPTTVTVQDRRGSAVAGVSVGNHRYKLAARLLGAQPEEELAGPYRATSNCSYRDWCHASLRSSQLLAALGGADGGFRADTDALRVLELASAPFLLMVLNKAVFSPARPDMLHAPMGVPLLVAAAVCVAMNPLRFGLKVPTPCDQYACDRMRQLLRSSWRSLNAESEVLALDVVLDKGFKAACARAKRKGVMKNMELVQRTGQRVLTEVFTHKREFPGKGIPAVCQSVFAGVEQERLSQLGGCFRQPDAEVPFCTSGEQCVSLLRMVHSVEAHLRTGCYLEAQITPSNREALPKAAQGAAGKGGTVSQMCLLAVQASAETFATWCARGAVAVDSLVGIDTFLVSPLEEAPCCVCGAQVHVLAAGVFPLGGSACRTCSRRRCFACCSKVLKSAREGWDPCSACRPPPLGGA